MGIEIRNDHSIIGFKKSNYEINEVKIIQHLDDAEIYLNNLEQIINYLILVNTLV
jgi:hypothetical protein